MIAADTSTWVAFLEGSAGEDAQLLDNALGDRQILMVPVVLTELLSDPNLPSDVAKNAQECCERRQSQSAARRAWAMP
jgi:hypothetical protein